MRLLHCFLAALWWCSPAPAEDISAAEKAEYGGYPGRYVLLDSSSRDRQSLSTPVAVYVHDNGVEAALIGAIHVAEPEYYDRLNKLFGRYDVLLFEMVGGEGLRREEELRRRIDRSKPLGGADAGRGAGMEPDRGMEEERRAGRKIFSDGAAGGRLPGIERHAGASDPASGH